MLTAASPRARSRRAAATAVTTCSTVTSASDWPHAARQLERGKIGLVPRNGPARACLEQTAIDQHAHVARRGLHSRVHAPPSKLARARACGCEHHEIRSFGACHLGDVGRRIAEAKITIRTGNDSRDARCSSGAAEVWICSSVPLSVNVPRSMGRARHRALHRASRPRHSALARVARLGRRDRARRRPAP